MRFSWIALSVLLSLSGCSQKGAFDLFKIDEAHERSVEQLRSGTILLSLETKAIFSSVYLNKIDPQTYKDGEYFIISVYYEKDDRTNKKRELESNGYTVKLNGRSMTSSEILSEHDVRRNFMPIRNSWNRYYLIRFNAAPESALVLRLENNQTGSVELTYQK
ncbi:MAG: hypothetical protein PHW64_09385 [Sulfuricurvum sp.]|nr:hypothetical protein [Sulfuricurvum sp.]